MRRPNYLKQISGRVDKAEPGAVFVPSDFFDVAEAVKVNMCLNRLIKSGGLYTVMRGVYAKPRYSNMLNANVPPHSDNIAKAIARNYGWTVVPCGDTALNMLGLSTQVPSVWLYISDGPYKTYEADGVKLRFKRTNNKNEIVGVPYKTALVIQALKAIGKENITDEVLHKLSKILSKSEKNEMLEANQRITAWVYDCIRKICVEALDE